MTKTVGIALGGGGAKGLAHVSMLEVLDDLGVTPVMITGTSVGAIIGSMYASGLKAGKIRAFLDELIAEPESLSEAIKTDRLLGWLDYISLDIGRSSILAVDHLLDELGTTLGVSALEELAIPLRVVAADFWGRREVVFDRGPIVPAVAASFALPGIFKPVERNGRILIDGGCVNPVPYDHLVDHCDISIAIDVLGTRSPESDLFPSLSELIFNPFQIAEKSILREKMKAQPPTIYVDVEVENVKVMEFDKAHQIYAEAEPFKRQLRSQLESLL